MSAGTRTGTRTGTGTGAGKGAGAGAPRGRLARLALTLSRDKADTLLLLAATLMVLGPHAAHLPLWVSAMCACTLFWRGVITFRGTRMPPSMVLLPLAVAAMGGIFVTYKTLLGREAGVAMAVLLVAFKMLEMHARRDLFVVIFLCFFLLLTNFFYSQSIAMGVMMVLAIVALLTAQVTFQYSGAVPSLGRRLALGGKILGLAAPLALALFFLFPRIQGPLWGMPGDAAGGKTGLSNTMSPGNIADLAQSTEIAFRARFDGPAPRQNQLYWRGLVLGDFDGRTWTHEWRRYRGEAGNLALAGKALAYQVTLEPNGQRWLFALDMPGAIPQLEQGAAMTPYAELRAGERIDKRVRYNAASHLNYRLDAGMDLPENERWLALPRGFNPKAMQAGLDLQRETDPAQRVNAVLRRFRNEGFVYTLKPPLLGPNTVDDFLFGTKAGFCEHYASAFVYLMRAADVPARVVTGYQGGELNPVDGFMAVRQSDAHAWAEVWIRARGWIRVDPTAAVAPERVERSLARALPPGEQAGMGALGGLINLRLDPDSFLVKMRNRLSAMNNGWNQWVLNYDPERRQGLVDSLQAALANWRNLAALAAIGALLYLARRLQLQRRRDPVDALYSALNAQLARQGMARAPDEGPSAWSLRIGASAMAPARKDALQRFLQLYSAHKYADRAPDPALVGTLKRLLASIR
jgi:transglutaminase-like putative cysteine protease